jgi:hypothetical protein
MRSPSNDPVLRGILIEQRRARGKRADTATPAHAAPSGLDQAVEKSRVEEAARQSVIFRKTLSDAGQRAQEAKQRPMFGEAP